MEKLEVPQQSIRKSKRNKLFNKFIMLSTQYSAATTNANANVLELSILWTLYCTTDCTTVIRNI